MTALALAHLDGVAEQPALPVRGKDSDVAFQKVVVYRHPAVFSVARQILPLVQGKSNLNAAGYAYNTNLP